MAAALLAGYSSDDSELSADTSAPTPAPTKNATCVPAPPPLLPESRPSVHGSNPEHGPSATTVRLPPVKPAVITKPRKPGTPSSELPAALAAELAREGVDAASLHLVDVDAAAAVMQGPSTKQPTPRTAFARIVKASGVSRAARQRNQITALAADVAATRQARLSGRRVTRTERGVGRR